MATRKIDLETGFSSSEDDSDLDDEKIDYPVNNQAERSRVSTSVKTQSSSPSQPSKQHEYPNANGSTGAFHSGTYYQTDMSSSIGRASAMARRSSKSRDRTPSYSRSTSYDELKFDYNSKYFKAETFAKRKVSDNTVR